jgi:hypothetical protein
MGDASTFLPSLTPSARTSADALAGMVNGELIEAGELPVIAKEQFDRTFSSDPINAPA